MLRQLLIAKVKAQNQEVVLIWVILKRAPETKTQVQVAGVREAAAKEEGK